MCLEDLISWIYLLISAFVVTICVVIDHHISIWYYYDVCISNMVIVLLGLSLFAGIYCLHRKRKKTGKDSVLGKRLPLAGLLGCFSVLLLLMQIFIVRRIFFYVGWDLETLRNLAMEYLYEKPLSRPGIATYLQENPNNLWMYFLNVIALQIGDLLHINGYKLLVAGGILLDNLAVFLTGLSCYELTKSRRWSLFAYFAAFVFVGLSPWIMVPYTDIYGICLPIISFYFYVTLRKKALPVFWKTCLIVVPTLAGYHFKPVCVFVFIAIVMVEILYFKKEDVQIKRCLLQLASVVLCVLMVWGVDCAVKQYVWYKPDRNLEKPMEHYAMMALNEEKFGYYNAEDDAYTLSVVGYEQKKAANLAVIKQRLTDMGFVGYAKHLTKKNLLNYNIGMMGWGKELFFLAEDAGDIWAFRGPITAVLKDIYYPAGYEYVTLSFGNGGIYFFILAAVYQFIWINSLLFGLIAAIFSVKKEKRDPYRMALLICLIGVFAFVSLFETNARYLFAYIPFYILMAAFGVRDLWEKLQCHTKK